jgi:hypothetical protein
MRHLGPRLSEAALRQLRARQACSSGQQESVSSRSLGQVQSFKRAAPTPHAVTSSPANRLPIRRHLVANSLTFALLKFKTRPCAAYMPGVQLPSLCRICPTVTPSM